MLKYSVRRFLELCLALFLIITATFFLINAVPGDALTGKTMHMPEEVKQSIYARYGLDKPVLERYFITMNSMLHGDFGESIVYPGQTIQSMLKERLPVSGRLGLQMMVLGVSLGLILGVIAAMKSGTWIDRLIVFLSVLLISVPELVLGLLLQRYLCGPGSLFPPIGWPSGNDLWFGGWRYVILPTIAGSLAYIAS